MVAEHLVGGEGEEEEETADTGWPGFFPPFSLSLSVSLSLWERIEVYQQCCHAWRSSRQVGDCREPHWRRLNSVWQLSPIGETLKKWANSCIFLIFFSLVKSHLVESFLSTCLELPFVATLPKCVPCCPPWAFPHTHTHTTKHTHPTTACAKGMGCGTARLASGESKLCVCVFSV